MALRDRSNKEAAEGSGSRRRFTPRRWRIVAILAAVLSGGLLAAAFPPFDYPWLVWIWPIPLFIAIWLAPTPEPRTTGRFRWRSTRAWSGFKLGYLSGATFWLINLSFLLELRHITGSLFFAILGLCALALFLALYSGVFGSITNTLARPTRKRLHPDSGDEISRFAQIFASSGNALLLAGLNAAAWCGLEWLRGWLLTGFSWNGLGVALGENLVMAQAADLVGVTGLSFLPIFVICIGLFTIARIHLEHGARRLRPHPDFAIAMALVIGAFLYGVNKTAIPADTEDTLKIRALLVQPNISQELKWNPESATENYQALLDLTSPYLELSHHDLVVWPESALYFQFYHPEHEGLFDELLALAPDTTLVLGTNLGEPENVVLSGEAPEQFTNALATMRGDFRSHTSFYRKIHLVMFGEYVPLRHVFPPLHWLLSGVLPGDFDPGTSTEPLTITTKSAGEISLIPSICFEDTLGRLARKFVRDEPQLLVNVTNDGWFGTSWASELHLRNARFRCIELRRPMLRSANTGVSCFIDKNGSLFDRIEGDGYSRTIADPDTGSTHISGTLPGTIRLERQPPTTLYAAFGDWFALSCLAITALALLKRQFAR